jgi:hypothetical protein
VNIYNQARSIGTVVSAAVGSWAEVVGREAELAALHEALHATPGGPLVRVLTGMGGVGKSSLVRAYAQRHVADYGVVWWIHTEEPSAVEAQFRELLQVLAPHDTRHVTNAIPAVHALLGRRDDTWLLVLDNVADPAAARSLVPAAVNGHVLVTSRVTTRWPAGWSVAVHPLAVDASVDLLTSLSLDADRDSAVVLAEELGGLPLALAQAASFIQANAFTLAGYLRNYREQRRQLHSDGRLDDYPHTVATTWQVAIDRLPRPARTLLNLMSLCAPDEWPFHLLLRNRELELPDEVEPLLRPLLGDEITRHRALGELRSYSLVTTGPGHASVHRLIQSVTRDHLDEEGSLTVWVRAAYLLLTAALPRPPATADTLATWRALHPHLLILLEYLPSADRDTLSVRRVVARWTGLAGDAAGARDLYAELGPVQEEVFGADHDVTLTVWHDLAHWTGQAGDPAGAREQFAALLPRYIDVLGAGHPHTLTTRHNLARWTGLAGDAAGARDLFVTLVPDWEREGTHWREVHTTRHDLAHWTGNAGDATEARRLFAELLPMRATALGDEDPDTLATRHNLAYWTARCGDRADALAMFEELLPVRRRVLGPEHPDTLNTWENLAHRIGIQGDAARARDEFVALLAVRERTMGPHHPHTLATRSDIAQWTGHAGDAATARDLCTTLLEMCRQTLGEHHRDTLTTRSNLAHWTGLAGDPVGARDQFAALLTVREPLLGSDHPDTVGTRRNLTRWSKRARGHSS